MDLSRLHGSDRAYFDTLVLEHGALVYGVVRSFAQEAPDADDLYQKVWMTVWTKRRSFRGDGPFRSWLYQVAMNVCRSHARSERVRRKRREMVAARSPMPLQAVPDPLARLSWRDEVDRVRRALSTLPDRQQQVLLLTRVEGMSTREVARLLGIEPASVRSHLRYALRALRAALEEPDDDVP